MTKKTIVTLSDSNYFPLLLELIDSINTKDKKKSVSICVLDAGLTEEQNKIIKSHNIDKDENNHLIIKAGTWFSMKSNGKYSLIGCTVAPAFDYKDFELAPPKWSPG